MPTTHEVEERLRELLAANDVPAPDAVEHRADGSVLALWHAQKVAIVIEPDELSE